jgi:UDP-glucuronate 4-epimerase
MIEAGQPIPVFGDGSSGRDYTYVDDIVDGILRAANADFRFEVFNLGNSAPILLSDLITALENLLRKSALIQFLPAQPGDVPVTCADIEKAGRLLGYSPATPFRQGLETFIQWHRQARIKSMELAGTGVS